MIEVRMVNAKRVIAVRSQNETVLEALDLISLKTTTQPVPAEKLIPIIHLLQLINSLGVSMLDFRLVSMILNIKNVGTS
ncbi:hypothetical protein A8938_3057 [Algoriphagus zhangzhouensis]|uniref:Uncharacterized protein n=1 Tax=Algoriphagus zhangzhouensis TaxID=1073327 RepID=A0A1M7ZGA0_9BACT|nr:hypothetical protein A8938_3057 [Algoriphagus zhangzhouensis]SHO63862.1 hypothetical protein SAMN04488108_3028 [Algoriphagus zhangzhouensis]